MEFAPWDCALGRGQAAKHYDPATRRSWRDPVAGPWLQSSCIEFLAHVEANKGAEDTAVLGSTESMETDGLCGVVPLACLLATADTRCVLRR